MPDLDSNRMYYDETIGCYRPKEVPNFQFFVDLLALRYGLDKIRVARPENFGRTQKVAVYVRDKEANKEFGFAIPLCDQETGFDIREKMFEFLYQQGFPREIPPIEEWSPLPEIKPQGD